MRLTSARSTMAAAAVHAPVLIDKRISRKSSLLHLLERLIVNALRLGLDLPDEIVLTLLCQEIGHDTCDDDVYQGRCGSYSDLQELQKRTTSQSCVGNT